MAEHEVKGSAKGMSKARATAKLINQSNASVTFEVLKEVSDKMNQLYERLNSKKGVEAEEFIVQMNMLANRLNQTLYDAEQVLRAAQAEQRMSEISEKKKKVDEKREKLQFLEKRFLHSFRAMDKEREMRTIMGLQDTLDKLLIIYPGMTLGMLKVFLSVCMTPGLTLADYCDKTGMARSTVSRHLLHLGPKPTRFKAKEAKVDANKFKNLEKQYGFLNAGAEEDETEAPFNKGLELIVYGKSNDNVSNFYAPSDKGKSILKVIKENIYKSLHAFVEENYRSVMGNN